MKKIKIGKFLTFFCVLAALFVAIPHFLQTKNVSAENFFCETIQDSALSSETEQEYFYGETISDENFSVTMSATSRKKTLLIRDEQMDKTDTITFLCFKWRDLLRLNFQFIANTNPNMQFGEYEFRVVHVGKDDLQPILNNFHETLYQGVVGDFKNTDFRYFIDTTFDEEDTDNNAAGHGFGLYKFDFLYEYWNSAAECFEQINLGKSFYVAVLPDTNVKELIGDAELSIVHSVESSNHMLNVYNLGLSRDVLKYVRPDLVVWLAYGKSIDNEEYCLTEEMQSFDESLINRFVIWDEYPQSIYGPTFKLETKDIEGYWTAQCIIRDTGGDVILTLEANNLSTVKVAPKSYVWLILLILGILLLLLLIVALVITYIMKKREKVW